MGDLQVFLPSLLKGVNFTVQITILSLILSLIIGFFLALGRMSKYKIVNWFCRIFISVFRGTPLLVQLIYIYFALPTIGIELTAFQAAVIGLALNESAYIAEIFRAGIQSVPKGQTEAAKSIGMRASMAMRRIIFPQAIKNVLPAIGNAAIILLKNSSLAAVITVVELTRSGEILAASTFKTIEVYTLVALLYWLLHYPLALLVNYLESRGDYTNDRSKKS